MKYKRIYGNDRRKKGCGIIQFFEYFFNFDYNSSNNKNLLKLVDGYLKIEDEILKGGNKMKKVIAVLVLLFPLNLFAQEETIRCNDSNNCSVTIVKPVEMTFFERANLASIVGNTRIAELCTTRAEFYTGVYLPIVSFKAYGYELVNFNFGAAAKNSDIEKGIPYFAIGFRADGMLGLLGVGNWAKEHLTIAKLPPLELGPFLSYNFRDEIWLVGAFISTKIGGI